MLSAAEIAAGLDRSRASSGGGFTACCPAHEDREPSLSIADGRSGPVVHCHAGCPQEAVLEALAARGLELRKPKTNGHAGEHAEEAPTIFNVAALAHSKLLSAESLRHWSVQDVPLNDGASAVGFEYLDRAGGLIGMKIRRALAGNRGFFWRKGSKPALYGLWRIDEMRELDNRLIICEGETDTLTLWQHDFCAVGLPGASMWDEGWIELLPLNDPVYVIIEPDKGGETVLKWLEKSALKSRARIIRMPAAHKDPSALYIADPDNFTERFEALLKAAEPLSGNPDRRPIRWSDLQGKTPPQRSWRISHWLTVGPTLLAGSGGVGKTLIAQTIATALALGKPFLDEVAEPINVLMWACEDDHDELWRRQIAICAHFGVPLSALEGRLIVEPRLGRENTLYDITFGSPTWTPLRDELRAQVNDYKASAMFLDNIGHTFGAKESDRHQVTAFLNGLMGLAPDLSAIVMGHPSKTADSEFSGSTAWENAVRMRWYMGYRLPDQKGDEEAEEDQNVRYLAKRKANYSERDYRKLEFRDGLFVPEVHQSSFSQRWGGADRNSAAETCLLRALAQIAQAGIRVTDGKTSPDYLPKKMREMKLAHDFTPKELSSALSQLRLSGKVVEGVVGRYGNRTTKTGLVVAL